MTVNEPALAPRAPRRSLKQWGGFVHLLARFYMNYYRAVLRAARRKKHRAVDIDTQPSKQGTPWALHWATLGKNKLHDPHKEYGPDTRIDHLDDNEIMRMRGPRNQKPYRLIGLLVLAGDHHVRVEVELKAMPNKTAFQHLLANSVIKQMLDRGDLQIKTLAGIHGAPERLAPVHGIGYPTILSFDKYKGPGISKSKAWPVADYVRGHAKWVA